ncbi:hypothetical protein [Aneurinibacillus tyrosinisolvens]|uniref:hypothetical protein n=1 Tax=Aneurinibacillus tyrosinisolvens TaxID=1443435 RepID=UPI00063ED4C1|nr:hypothetical protein [Aneurinibacillus tyrosinisolvens]
MSELVYTSSSMLKMVFRSGERSLSRQEVESRLQNTYSTSLMKMNVLPERVIEEAMADEQSPFHIGGSHAVIEMETTVRDHIAEELVRYLLENKGPLTTDQCLKKLRRHNVVPIVTHRTSYPSTKIRALSNSMVLIFGTYPDGTLRMTGCIRFWWKKDLSKYRYHSCTLFWNTNLVCPAENMHSPLRGIRGLR